MSIEESVTQASIIGENDIGIILYVPEDESTNAIIYGRGSPKPSSLTDERFRDDSTPAEPFITHQAPFLIHMDQIPSFFNGP